MKKTSLINILIAVLFVALFATSPPVEDTGTAIAQSSTCVEGEFLSLIDNTCYPLEYPEYGYQLVEYSGSVYRPQCSEGDIRSALGDAGQSGGTVELDNCKINLGADLYIPGGVIFEGGRSVFDLSSGAMIRISESRNVEFKNITLQAKGESRFPIWIQESSNILIEHVAVSNARQGNIRLSFTPHATIRYSVITGAKEFHGISGKDCFGTSVDDDCEPESEYWSFYSNVFSGNNSHGANPHSSYGEFAGNMSINNGYGAKFPDSHSVTVQRNLIKNNGGWGIHIYRTYTRDEDRKSYNIRLIQNEFDNNGIDVRIKDDLQRDGVHLVFNDYDKGLVIIDPSMVHGCPDSEDVRRSKIKPDSPYCDSGILPTATPTVNPTITPNGTIPNPTITPTATPLPTSTPDPIYLTCYTVEDLEVLVCQEYEN